MAIKRGTETALAPNKGGVTSPSATLRSIDDATPGGDFSESPAKSET